MNPLSENQFRNKIVYWRLVLCYMVLLIHAYNVTVYCREPDKLSGIFVFENYVKTWSALASPFFFIISGYLFFRTFQMDQLFQKYRSRLKTLAIPYILWCVVYYLVMMVITNTDPLAQLINGPSVSLSVSDFAGFLRGCPYNAHFWYLKVLIFLVVVTPVIYLILKNRMIGACVLLLLMVLNCLDRIAPERYINTYYLFGAYLALHYPHMLKAKSARKFKYAAVLLAALTVAVTLLFILGGGDSLYGQMMQYSPAAVGLFMAGWFFSDRISFDREPKWWMDISFFVYCSFSLILETLEKIFLKLFGVSELLALADFIVMPVLAYIVCILCAYLLRRFFRRLYTVLAGGR